MPKGSPKSAKKCPKRGPKRGPKVTPPHTRNVSFPLGKRGVLAILASHGGPFWVPFWVHFGVHFGVIFGSVPGSLLGSALEHLLHRNTSKTKRFWCFGGFGKGLISGHVPAPFQGTFLVIILVRFGGNFLTASLGVATPGFHVKLGFELSLQLNLQFNYGGPWPV